VKAILEPLNEVKSPVIHAGVSRCSTYAGFAFFASILIAAAIEIIPHISVVSIKIMVLLQLLPTAQSN